MPEESKKEMTPANRQAEARVDFDSAYMKGFWHEVMSWFLQRKNSLLPFDEVRKVLPIKGQHFIGIRQVPLDQIVGSVGRYQDFDAAFSPRQTRTMGRWMSVDVAHLQEIELPPVELYKIGEVYFVKDGNHRVSVAHEKNQAYMDAEVIEIDIDVPLTKETDLEKLILNLEKRAFEERTQIETVHPGANYALTLPGQYEKLLEHIDVHRWYLGKERQAEVSYLEALKSWYATVYMPLVEIIRQKGILKDFPGRTEADLYLWIIEHYWYLAQSTQEDISLEQAAEDYRQEFSQRLVKKMAKVLKRAVRAMKGGRDIENEAPTDETPPESQK